MEEGIPKINLEGFVKLDMRKGKKGRRVTKGKFWTKRKKMVFGVVGGVFVFAVGLVVVIGLQAYAVYGDAMKLIERAKRLNDSLQAQDIGVIRSEVDGFRGELEGFEKSVSRFSWSRGLPFVGPYYKDSEAFFSAAYHGLDAARIGIETIEPYADIIGLRAGAEQAGSPEETANDRIDFLVSTIDEITPRIDEISGKVKLIQDDLSKIDPGRYPEQVRGVELRAKMIEMFDLVDEGARVLGNSKPLLEKATYLLGVDEERVYLVLFQNDKELRPTGGFITAYSVMRVNNGKVEPVSSNDIYNLDSNYKPRIKAPDVLVDYLMGPYKVLPYYRLRDMNFNPDFSESMKVFVEEAKTAGISGIDGVIAVDTKVLEKLLNVLGQIGVPGFGNFSTEIIPECNCPQVIYELESFADVEGAVVWSQDEPDKIIFAPPNYENRKKIVGPLMNSILSNSLGQPKEKLPDLFTAAWESVMEKHVLMYMLDEEVQKAVADFGLGGTVSDYDGDYLHINDANLGGRKSNLYVATEVHQDVVVGRDGSVEKTLVVTYKNPQDYDGWLNSVLPNWTRIYLPKGSEIVSVSGFEDVGETYEELGKTVVSGGFELRPLGVTKIEVVYKLPFKVEGEYKLFVQKQPGLDSPLYTFSVGKQEEELFLKTDKEFSFDVN